MTNARTAAHILTVGLLLDGLTACTGDSDEDPSESTSSPASETSSDAPSESGSNDDSESPSESESEAPSPSPTDGTVPSESITPLQSPPAPPNPSTVGISPTS